MKKSITIFTLILLTLLGCKSKKKEVSTKENKTEINKSAKYMLAKAVTNVNFTAYKTTEKIPVKGKFKKIRIINNPMGNTIRKSIENTIFEIPVSSIETNNTSRNYKIQKFFFNIMEDTFKISGKLNLIDDSNGTAAFTMNGITQKTPFTYSVSENIFTMKATIDIDKWNAQKAIESLNTACKELHKGKDGISKTWNEVTLEASVSF